MREVLGLRELGGEDDGAGDVVAFDELLAPGDESADGPEPPDDAVSAAGWRRRTAAGVVIALFVGVGYMLTFGRPPGAGPPSVGPDAGQAPARPTSESVEDAARAALDAWARFADSGDVDHLGVAFDRGGPQFARLQSEARVLATRPAAGARYSFTATGLRVSPRGQDEERVVEADVVVSRAGETDQRFAWQLVMRNSEGQWRLWTVRDRVGADGGRPVGGP
jgi:hypothetical protein